MPKTHKLAFIIMDYEGIMDIIMKTLCVLGISNRHGRNCTSAVAQVNVHNLPNSHKVPKQHSNAEWLKYH
jgi:hypothetical protein